MSRSTRFKLSSIMEPEAQEQPTPEAVTASRENVITLQQPPAPAEPAEDSVRHGYRATLYLPREAQYKLHEIALAKRRKPHDVLMEVIAEMFAANNAGDVATQIRARLEKQPTRGRHVTT